MEQLEDLGNPEQEKRHPIQADEATGKFSATSKKSCVIKNDKNSLIEPKY